MAINNVEDELDRFLEGIKGVTCLTDMLRIYAPTCHGKCLLEVDRLIDSVNRVTGGSTVYDAEGSWFNEELGKVETEPVRMIEAGHRCFSEEDAGKIAEAISEYTRDAKQHSMAVYGSNLYIAETPDLLKAYEKFKEKKPTIM